MKRFFVISLALCILGAIIFSTGCSCYCTGDPSEEPCRGFGYECLDMGGCADAVYDYTVATQGVDYSMPEVWVEKISDTEVAVYYNFETYRNIRVKYDFCVMQDGVIIGRKENLNERSKEFGIGKHNECINVTLDGYKSNGGDVYVILNRFSGVLI